MYTYEKFNSRIQKQNKEKSPYEILVKYEHGDADLTTKEKFKYKNESDFVNAAQFFYECFNFVPNVAYEKLGYFYPIPADSLNGRSTEDKVWKDVVEIGKKYGIHEDEVYEYIQHDQHYHQGFADLDGIKAKVNGENRVFVFKKALETNKIVLPNIGDVLNIDVNHIPGLGKKLYDKKDDYLPNSGAKDFLSKTFKAKVLDCVINFYHDYDNKYYTSYTHFDYVLLLETFENVLKSNPKNINKLVYSMKGYDPDFETKFNKDKYDGLNYYEID